MLVKYVGEIISYIGGKLLGRSKIFGTFSSKYENVSLPGTFNQHPFSKFENFKPHFMATPELGYFIILLW